MTRRSTDGGNTWSPLQTIADAGQDSLNNPLVVRHEQSRRILLMYQRYPKCSPSDVTNPDAWRSHAGQDFAPNFHEGAVQEGYSGRVCLTFIQSSSDRLESWTPPVDITCQVKRPTSVTSYAGGPGHGIELRDPRWRGRLVMPYSQGPWGNWRVYAVISDDSGVSWRRGKVAGTDGACLANEVQFAELDNGDLYLNARGADVGFRRLSAISRDGGLTWTALQRCPGIPDPQCHGSLLSWAAENNSTLIYCGPNDATGRRRGMLLQSPDRGASWIPLQLVYSGAFAYSDLARIDEQRLGLLFERDDYTRISFCTFYMRHVRQESGVKLPQQEK